MRGAGDASVVSELAANMAGERTNDIDLFGDQHLAARALGALYGKGGRDALVKLLSDTREFSGLGPTAFGDLAAFEIMDRATIDDVPLLEAFCKDDHRRPYALPALIRVSPEAARPWLIRGMEDKETYVRLRSALELARTGDDKAIAYLEASCYENLGQGGVSGQDLITANHEKARAAYLRVFHTAREPGNDARHRAARINAYHAFGSTEEMVPVLKDVLPVATDAQLRALWDSLRGQRRALSKIAPVLDAALARKEYAAVVSAVEFAILDTDTETKLATRYLTACFDTNATMQAVRIGHARGLLTPEAIRPIARRHLNDPEHQAECVALLSELGHRGGPPRPHGRPHRPRSRRHGASDSL